MHRNCVNLTRATQTMALQRNELTITSKNLFCFAFYRQTLKLNIAYLLRNPAAYLTSLSYIVQNEKGTSFIYSLFNLSSALQWLQELRVELVIYILDNPERCISELEAEVRFPQCLG